jgi:SAM-dependent methyltransferase
MNLKTALALSRGGRLRLLWRVTSLFTPIYRVTFVAAASSSGVLRLLADGPKPLSELARTLAPDPSTHAGLEAWLELGVRLHELARDERGYRLAGYLARKLADPANDEVAALVEEVASFHHRLILESPARWRRGALWKAEEHDGVLIARSSRIMEPFVFQVIDGAIPRTGALRLLEVACGAGTYIRHAAERNPELTAVGLELQPEVAAATRAAAAGWGLGDRIAIETGDIRAREGDASFDVVTLYNAIYYFSVAERVALFARLRAWLKPGGRLILSTSCRGGSPGMQLLNVWTSNVDGFGPLPIPAELESQLRAAGFGAIDVQKVIPGEQYFALTATRPRTQELA